MRKRKKEKGIERERARRAVGDRATDDLRYGGRVSHAVELRRDWFRIATRRFEMFRRGSQFGESGSWD